ncbi:addiction module toxin RelE [Candidatus Peregrinibacteria bacterium RIFOXYB2_FULL_32_7]|nr:MAG: addiction module toxin RelE [Candidatus Peregrinibacteria bacterium RIFOXYB2_FULL_32_7]
MTFLIQGEKLPDIYKDHKLKGKFKNKRECHIEPDWLLIYEFGENYVIFERIGSHAELFE